jgi:O-antigen/teichoic acid export membrane protein
MMAINSGALMEERKPSTIDKKLLVVNSLATAAAHVVNLVVLIWVVQHLLKRIPSEEFVLLPLASSLVMFLPIALDAFTSGIARFVTVAHAAGDTAAMTRIASTMCVVNTVAAVVTMAVLGLAAWKIDVLLGIAPEYIDEARWVFLLLTGSAVLALPTAPLVVGMHVRQRFLVSSAISVVSTLIRAGLLVALIVGVGPKVVFVAVATFASTLFTQIASVVASMMLLPSLRFSPEAIEFRQARSIMTFGVWSTVGRTADAIRQGADPLILNHFSIAAEVATFHVGSLIDRQVRTLMSMMVTPLEPVFTGLHADGDNDRLGNAFLRATRLALWITMPLLVPLLVFREEIMKLYLGQAYLKFDKAPTVMGLLLLTFPLFTVLTPIFLLARGRGHLGEFTRWVVAGQFLNLFITVVLVGPFRAGATGSAMATLLVAMLYPFVVWPIGCRLAHIPVSRYVYEVGVGIVPSLTIAAVALASRWIIVCDTWSRLAVAVAATACLGWLATIPWLRTPDRNDLRTVVNRVYSLCGRRSDRLSES